MTGSLIVTICPVLPGGSLRGCSSVRQPEPAAQPLRREGAGLTTLEVGR